MTMKRHRQETKIFESIISSIDFQELKDIPLFGDDKWYAAEEIVLLTFMESHSYGNWSLLAEILTEKFHKKFTAEEVEEHYINTYLEGDIATAMRSGESNIPKSSLIDHTSKEDAEWLKSVDMKACENVPQKFLEKIGYMPLREDFVREYDPVAEDLIQNLDFSLSTDDYDKNVNMILLDTYRNRIMERIERKKAVKKFRIVEQFFAKCNPSSEKKFLEDKLLSPEPYNIPKVDDGDATPRNKKTLRSKKLTFDSRYQRLKQQSPEKRLTQHTNCDDDEEVVSSKERSRVRKRRSLRSNKTMKLLTVHSDNSSENEAIESDKKSDLTIEDYPESEFLTRAEKRLCTDLGLKPSYYRRYLHFLTYIDLEKSEGRYLNESMVPAHMTVAQCSRIVNFLEKVDLLKNQNLLNVADD